MKYFLLFVLLLLFGRFLLSLGLVLLLVLAFCIGFYVIFKIVQSALNGN